TATVIYKVPITDSRGASAIQPVKVTITGNDGAPTSVAGSTTATGAISADLLGQGTGNETTAGTIAFADVDLTDTHTASKNFVSAVWQKADGTTVPFTVDLGALTLGLVNDTSKTVGWTYTVSDSAINFLAAHETITVKYNVTVTDNNGLSSPPQLVTITIGGTNEAPTIVAGSTTATGAITEDLFGNETGSETAAGTIAFADVNLTDTHTASKNFVSAVWQKADGTTVPVTVDPG